MTEIAHLFKLKTADAFIIAARPDLASYNLLDVDASNWSHEGTVELTSDGLRKYAIKADDVIKAIATNGYYSVLPQDYRFIRDQT